MLERPTHREIGRRLEEAKAALIKGQGLFVDPAKAIGELDDMNLDAEDVWPLILKCLYEIRPEHYSGARPPLKSYEHKIFGKELFAFSWDSECCEKKMYLKFVISAETFYYVSFHRDRPEKKSRF